MWQDFDLYFEAIRVRNKETHEDGHLIAYNFPEHLIEENRKYFQDCWKTQLSPHKALCFLPDYLAPGFLIN